MRIRFQPWQLAVLLVVACASVIGFVRWRKLAHPFDAQQMFSALPIARGTLLYLDVETLRKSGVLNLLAGSKAAEEPDYRNFVEQTGFDYRTDLDAAAAVFDGGEVYVTVRGHFDWKQLSAYARTQGGTCQYLICTMVASTAGHNISFYPLREDVLALAVTTEERGVNMITAGQAKPQVLPTDPAWLWVPKESLHSSASDSPVMQLLLVPLADAQNIALSAGPGAGTSANTALRLRAVATFPSASAAATLTKQFQSLTGSLRQLSAKTGASASPGADSTDMAALLAQGTIAQKDSVVTAEWPLNPAFLKSLAEGRPR